MKHAISPPHREKNGRKKREQSSEVQAAFLEAGRFYDAESGDRVGPMHTLTGRRFWTRVSGNNPSPEWDATGAVLNGDVFPNPFGRLVALSEIQRTLSSKEPEISPPEREKSGRKKRSTKAEIEAAQREALAREQAKVLSQPHRRGDNDQRLYCALGQVCKLLHLRDEQYRAGEEYATIVRRWMVAVGGIKAEGHKAIGLFQDEITREVADRLTAQLEDADAVLRRAGAYPWVRHICVDYPAQNIREFPLAGLSKVQRGLFDLAVHFGMLKPYHGR